MKKTGIHAIAIVACLCVAASGHAAEKSRKGAKADKGQWSYSGKNGPDKWGTLDKNFEECKIGQAQSPIDIPADQARKGDFPPLLFIYKPTRGRIIDTGYTIQVNLDPGNSVSVGDKKYDLFQFHFHKPSEEKINGRGHDMDVHLMHKDAEGKIGVIAVLLDAGKPNRLMKTVTDQLPKEKKTEVPLTTDVNVVDLLPDTKGYYSFSGSLTEPPCSENVTWFVLKNPARISAESIARFGKVYPMNARPVQPLNSRDVMVTVR